MSKLYEKYLKEKNNNKEFLYLFECGKFYIFLDEDAKYISSITTLKLTNLNNNVLKCGFPNDCLDKYISIFNNLNLNIKIINKVSNNIDLVLNKIKYLDIESLTYIELLNILKELKDNL